MAATPRSWKPKPSGRGEAGAASCGLQIGQLCRKRLWRQNVGDRFFYKFWGQGIRYVARRDAATEKKSWIEIRPVRAQPGEQAQIALALRGDDQPGHPTLAALPATADLRRQVGHPEADSPLDTIGSTRSTTIATPADAIEARPALPIYLTPKKVARMLEVNERTVLRWAAEDPSMPTIRIGRVIRWEQDALFRWLAKKRPRKSMSGVQRARA